MPLRHLLLIAGFSAVPFLAAAQSPHTGHGQQPAAASKPAAARQPAPSPEARLYRSAFEDFRPFKPDEPLVEWRGANDTVREIGGHVGLMKGSAGAGAASAPGAHGGHGAHGGKKEIGK